MRNLLTAIIITVLTMQASAANMCSNVFLESPGPHFDALTAQLEVTESQIFKAAQKDLLGDRTLSQRAKDSALDFFNILNINRDYRKQLTVELQRRDYKAALERMGIKTKVDAMYILRRNSHYFKMLFSIGANAAVNIASYHYLGIAGMIVSIPRTGFFRPDKIPDAVILEMMTKPQGGPLAKAYLGSRVKHSVDAVTQSVGKFLTIGLLSWFAIFHHQVITDPNGYMEQQMMSTTTSVLKVTYLQNLETIKAVEAKKAAFERDGQMDRVRKAEALIASIQQQNSELYKQVKNEK